MVAFQDNSPQCLILLVDESVVFVLPLVKTSIILEGQFMIEINLFRSEQHLVDNNGKKKVLQMKFQKLYASKRRLAQGGKICLNKCEVFRFVPCVQSANR